MSLVFLFVTIIFVYAPTSVFAEDDYRYGNCSASFQCGNISDIGYPFYGGDRSSYCGYPGYELTDCSSEGAVITIMNLTYQVMEINNDSQILTVARTDYVSDVCPTYLHTTTLNSSLFNFTSDDQNVTLYYDCPTVPSNIFTNISGLSTKFSCTINSTEMENYFLTNRFATLLPLLRNNYLNLCNQTIYVPANESYISSLEKDPTQANLVSTLGKGFGLQYQTEADSLCRTCRSSEGQCGRNESTGSFLCFCKDQPQRFACPTSERESGSGGRSRTRLPLFIGSIITGVVLFGIVLGCCYCYCAKKKTSNGNAITRRIRLIYMRKDEKIESMIMFHQSHIPKRYSYTQIYKMTNSFKNKLGEGGFGRVYKGRLSDGHLAAIKILNKSEGEGEEFINEVASFSRTSHVNIIRLLGFCYERKRRALIYEYMPNGSLDKFIQDQSPPPQTKSLPLPWEKLYQISIGIARGLEYLHQGCVSRIVHFDIKPQNILLDEDFCPKISDFGLAKLYKTKESNLSSLLGARGTIGYIAPEVFCRNFGEVSYKSDVYSYGMMVLDMVGKRQKNGVGGSHSSSETYFPDWIYKELETGAKVTGEEDEDMVRKMTLVGLWCIQTMPSSRPSMTKVIEMLEGSVESLHVPPKPFMSSPPRQPLEYSSTASTQTFIKSQMSVDKEKGPTVDEYGPVGTIGA